MPICRGVPKSFCKSKINNINLKNITNLRKKWITDIDWVKKGGGGGWSQNIKSLGIKVE